VYHNSLEGKIFCIGNIQINQVQIAGALDIPSDRVAEKLLEMEREGLIERE
jgi:hypothetical protein